uniref:Uncharacterized protein n=1 Tax=Caudovirales sp. ctIbU14 TaxID=2825761 RepID=A0A8S5NT32_9CAUD|nr:MAG TPA: hypothetical protein [Caudovirales sp. ctIbU14]
MKKEEVFVSLIKTQGIASEFITKPFVVSS